jgi:hypothetical protein
LCCVCTYPYVHLSLTNSSLYLISRSIHTRITHSHCCVTSSNAMISARLHVHMRERVFECVYVWIMCMYALVLVCMPTYIFAHASKREVSIMTSSFHAHICVSLYIRMQHLCTHLHTSTYCQMPRPPLRATQPAPIQQQTRRLDSLSHFRELHITVRQLHLANSVMPELLRCEPSMCIMCDAPHCHASASAIAQAICTHMCWLVLPHFLALYTYACIHMHVYICMYTYACAHIYV